MKKKRTKKEITDREMWIGINNLAHNRAIPCRLHVDQKLHGLRHVGKLARKNLSQKIADS